MSDEKTAILEKEIARLNLIIDALVSEIQTLKHSYSVSEKGNGTTEAGSSVAEKGNGITGAGYSVNEKSNGITDVGNSVVEKGNGITEVGYSVSENGNGITDVWRPVSEKGNGITEVLRPLSEKVEPSPSTISRVNQKLRAMEGGKVKRSGSINSAKLLVHFHNNNSGSHPVLRKLTGLSKGGLAKLIMSLTRRGLIVRDGWQKFALTALAKKLMREALG